MSSIPLPMGFPAYGRGPFEGVGIPTTLPLLVAFFLVCVLEAVAGFLLWGGYKSGAVLALVGSTCSLYSYEYPFFR
ncbi:MAG: hypothetical protein C4331_19340 [Meiothermus sp.]